MRERDEAAIQAVELAYDAAWNAGDVGAMIAVLTEDAVIVNPLGQVASGRAEIARMLGEFLAGRGKGSTHSTAVERIHFPTGGVAVFDGEATIDLADGTSLVHRFTDVLIEREGSWLIAHVRAYVFMSEIA